MSQVFLSCFQELLDLSNLVLQLPLLLGERVQSGLDPPMLILEPERVDGRSRETPNELYILVYCLSVLRWHTGTALREDLP